MPSIWELFVRLSGDNSNFKQSFKESGGILTAFEQQAASSGAKILGALSFTALAAGALASAEKFQEAGFTIQRSTGASGERLAGLNQAFKDLYATSAKGADVIAASLSTITRETGAQGEQLEKLTKANLAFAKVTGTDVKEAIDSTQVVFKQWGVTAGEQAAKLDVLYKIQTLTGISTANLGAEMAAVGPTMRALGFSFNESVAFVGAFEEAGLKASDMVRGMNAAFVKWAEAGKDPKQALADLIEKLKDTKTAAAAANALIAAGFSARSVVAMADAVKRGALDIEDLTKKASDSAGAVDEMAKNTTTLGAEFTKLYRNVEKYLADPGPGLLSWLTKGIAGFNELASKIGVVTALLGGGRGAALALQSADADAAGMAAYDARMLKGQKFGFGTPPPGTGGADPNAVPATLKAGTLDTLVGVEILNKEEAAMKSLVSTLAEWRIKGRDVATVSSEISKILDVQANVDLPSVAQSVDVVAGTFDDALNPAIKQSEELMHALGIASVRELRAQYDAARRSTEALILLGAAQSDITASAEVMAARYKDLSVRLGEWDQQTQKVTKSHYDLGRELEQMSHRTFDSVERGIADMTAHWSWSLGNVKKMAQDFAADFLHIMLKGLLSPLEDAFAASMKKLGGMLANALGIGGNAASSGASAAGSAASSAGGAASSVGGAASGVMGIIGAVGAAVGAVSSVIGNFQMAGMNKSLDLIEHNTRYSMMYLGERADGGILGAIFKMSEQITWGPGVKAMEASRDILMDIRASLQGGGGGGKSAVTFNNCNFTGSPQQIADSIFTQAALAGVAFP